MNKLSVLTKMLCALLCLGVSQRSIAQTPEYDIAIGTADSNGLSYFEKGDFVRVGCSQYIASHHIPYWDLKEWFWGAKIVNKGYKDILPAAHPRIRMSIDYTDILGNNYNDVYIDTIIGGITDTVKVGDINGLALVSYFRDINFINNIYGFGEYSVTYWVQQDSIDGDATNDTIRHSFEITNGENCAIEGYISKARRSASDGRVHGSTISFPEEQSYQQLEYGSVFYFPLAGNYPNDLDSIEFRYHVSAGFTGASSQTLLVNIYHYEDGAMGGNANGFMEWTELTHMGITTASLTGLGTTILNGSNGVKSVSGFVDAFSGGPMLPFVGGEFYYISVWVNPSLFGGQATFGLNDVPVVMSDEINYAMNIGMTSATVPILPSVMIVTDSTGSTILTEYDKVPSIGIYRSYCYSNIDKNPTESSTLTLYPNPTTNHLNIQTTFQEPTDVQYIITNITGRVYYIYNNKNSSTNIHAVDITALPAGVYLVSAKTEKGVSTEKFVKE